MDTRTVTPIKLKSKWKDTDKMMRVDLSAILKENHVAQAIPRLT